MMAAQQHAQHKGCKRIGHDQPRHFRPQESVTATITKHEQQFGDGQLHQDDAKDEKNARASRKALRLVDPKLSNRRGQDQQRNNEILGRLRLLATKNEKREATDKHRKDHDLRVRQVFQIAL